MGETLDTGGSQPWSGELGVVLTPYTTHAERSDMNKPTRRVVGQKRSGCGAGTGRVSGHDCGAVAAAGSSGLGIRCLCTGE